MTQAAPEVEPVRETTLEAIQRAISQRVNADDPEELATYFSGRLDESQNRKQELDVLWLATYNAREAQKLEMVRPFLTDHGTGRPRFANHYSPLEGIAFPSEGQAVCFNRRFANSVGSRYEQAFTLLRQYKDKLGE